MDTIIKIANPKAEDILKILALVNTAWPLNIEPGQELEFWKNKMGDREQCTCYVIEQGQLWIAHAMMFTLNIGTSLGDLKVAGLAGVCVHPDWRSKGLGASVVQAAFADLNELGADVVLYQTGVPDFYKALGAKEVSNSFITSVDDQKSPWWDPHVMIYPAHANWPEGQINLRGAGY